MAGLGAGLVILILHAPCGIFVLLRSDESQPCAHAVGCLRRRCCGCGRRSGRACRGSTSTCASLCWSTTAGQYSGKRWAGKCC